MWERCCWQNITKVNREKISGSCCKVDENLWSNGSIFCKNAVTDRSVSKKCDKFLESCREMCNKYAEMFILSESGGEVQ